MAILEDRGIGSSEGERKRAEEKAQNGGALESGVTIVFGRMGKRGSVISQQKGGGGLQSYFQVRKRGEKVTRTKGNERKPIRDGAIRLCTKRPIAQVERKACGQAQYRRREDWLQAKDEIGFK